MARQQCAHRVERIAVARGDTQDVAEVGALFDLGRVLEQLGRERHIVDLELQDA